MASSWGLSSLFMTDVGANRLVAVPDGRVLDVWEGRVRAVRRPLVGRKGHETRAADLREALWSYDGHARHGGTIFECWDDILATLRDQL